MSILCHNGSHNGRSDARLVLVGAGWIRPLLCLRCTNGRQIQAVVRAILLLCPRVSDSMASDNMDSAKGATTSSTVRPTSSVLTNISPEHHSYNAQDGAAQSPLELFQWLVGIHTPPCLKDPSEPSVREHRRWIANLLPCLKRSSKPSTRGDNIGLYQRSKDQERRSRIAYLLTSYISNTLFLLQIMLAAAFTGLSAYKEANAVTLTILGAFNTVVAGQVDVDIG